MAARPSSRRASRQQRACSLAARAPVAAAVARAGAAAAARAAPDAAAAVGAAGAAGGAPQRPPPPPSRPPPPSPQRPPPQAPPPAPPSEVTIEHAFDPAAVALAISLGAPLVDVLGEAVEHAAVITGCAGCGATDVVTTVSFDASIFIANFAGRADLFDDDGVVSFMKAQDERARAAEVLGDALATALCPRVPATGGSLSDRLFQLLSAELDATRARVGGCEVSVGASVIYFGLNSGGGRRLQSGSSRAGGLYLEFSLESSADVGTTGDPTAPLRDLAAFGDALAAAAAEASQSSWPSSAAPLAGHELAEVLVGDEWRTTVKASMLVRAASPSAAAAAPVAGGSVGVGRGRRSGDEGAAREGAAAAVASVAAAADVTDAVATAADVAAAHAAVDAAAAAAVAAHLATTGPPRRPSSVLLRE